MLGLEIVIMIKVIQLKGATPLQLIKEQKVDLNKNKTTVYSNVNC